MLQDSRKTALNQFRDSIKDTIGFAFNFQPAYDILSGSNDIRQHFSSPNSVFNIKEAAREESNVIFNLTDELKRTAQNIDYSITEMTRQTILFLVLQGRQDIAGKILENAAILTAATKFTEFEDITNEISNEVIGHISFTINHPKGDLTVGMLCHWEPNRSVTTKMQVGPMDPVMLFDESIKLKINNNHFKISNKILPESVVADLNDLINYKKGNPVCLGDILQTNLFDVNILTDRPLINFMNNTATNEHEFHFKPKTVKCETLKRQIRMLTEFSIDGKPI